MALKTFNDARSTFYIYFCINHGIDKNLRVLIFVPGKMKSAAVLERLHLLAVINTQQVNVTVCHPTDQGSSNMEAIKALLSDSLIYGRQSDAKQHIYKKN